MKAIRLKTEHLFNPLGIDIKHPRLMWNCEGGKKQTAYQIKCEDYDTGKVLSDDMSFIYSNDLSSRQRVNWSVKLWDENDLEGDWSDAFFEMGLLDKDDWKASWISGDYKVNKKKRYPVDCFKKEINIDKKIKHARLYATACGLYEARLNGEKIGDFCLAPGYTDYRKRVQYQTYDVTNLLKDGHNELTAELADGWYRGSCGAWGIKNQYGTETKLLLQLEIIYKDDTKEIIGTDNSWNWSNDGPIRFADNKDGEIIEAYRIPSYSGYAKKMKHNVVPSASNNVPVKEHEQFHPTITTSPNGKRLLDFGQNFAGYISFKVNASQGQKMIFRFGEMLDQEGNLTLKNIQLSNKKYTTPLQRIEYTCKDGENVYKTKFAVFGFRYGELDSDVKLNEEDICSIAVYSDFEMTGEFDSSNELLNKFYDATLWSAKSNHLDIPTDCPTRERHGWTGDAQLFFKSAAYLFDFAPFARKYLHDVYDWQRSNGRLPHIAPDGGADFYMWTMNGSVGWSDVGVLIPYRYAQIFDEEEILKEYYDGMAKYARFMISRIGKHMPIFGEHLKLEKKAKKYLVNKGQSYGEWAEPNDVSGGFHWQDFVAPHPEVSTAYTYYVLKLMSDIASRLGQKEDEKEFKKYSDGCKYAYQALIKTDKYPIDTDIQARLVRPLYMDLLSEEDKKFAQARLIKALENYNWRLGTGFLSTPLILYVLASYDIKAAYKLLENEEIPGWLSMPKNGATTIWEDWDGPNSKEGGIGSLNHYSKGAVVEWLFSNMCGINVAGKNHFVIKPLPGGNFKHASAKYNSVYGLVKSSWIKENDEYKYHIEIPANTKATIILNGNKYEVDAGVYDF